jgi:hypothetical protein
MKSTGETEMKSTMIRGVGNAAMWALFAALGSGSAWAQIYTKVSPPICPANGTGAECTNYLGAGLAPDPSGTWRVSATCSNNCSIANMSAEDSFDSSDCSQNIPWVGNGSSGPVIGQIGVFVVIAHMVAIKKGNNPAYVTASAECGFQDFAMPSLAWTLAPC